MNQKKVLLFGLCAAALLLLGILFMQGRDPAKNALKELGLDEVVWSYTVTVQDTHGGIQHDGTLLITFSLLEHENPALALQKAGWNAFPMQQALSCLLYGGSVDDHSYGNYIDGIPRIENGLWYFSDRQSPKTAYTEKDILSVYQRPSANFSVAVWDTEHHTLYYASYDS